MTLIETVSIKCIKIPITYHDSALAQVIAPTPENSVKINLHNETKKTYTLLANHITTEANKQGTATDYRKQDKDYQMYATIYI